MGEGLSLKDRIKSALNVAIEQPSQTLGLSVWTRLVSYKEYKSIMESVREAESDEGEDKILGVMTNVIRKHICDESGERVWDDSPESIDELSDLPLAVIQELVTLFLAANGGKTEALEDARKN